MPSFIDLLTPGTSEAPRPWLLVSLTAQTPLVPPTATGGQEYLVIITYCSHCKVNSLHRLENSNTVCFLLNEDLEVTFHTVISLLLFIRELGRVLYFKMALS